MRFCYCFKSQMERISAERCFANVTKLALTLFIQMIQEQSLYEGSWGEIIKEVLMSVGNEFGKRILLLICHHLSTFSTSYYSEQCNRYGRNALNMKHTLTLKQVVLTFQKYSSKIRSIVLNLKQFAHHYQIGAAERAQAEFEEYNTIVPDV